MEFKFLCVSGLSIFALCFAEQFNSFHFACDDSIDSLATSFFNVFELKLVVNFVICINFWNDKDCVLISSAIFLR